METYKERMITVMKIGLQMYTLRNVMNTVAEMEQAVARVKEIGYDCVQLAGSLEQMEQVGLAAKKVGLEVVSFMASLDVYMQDEEETFRVARLLGATDLGISSAHTTLEETKVLIERANAFAKRAKAAGFTLSYHNHSNELMHMDGRKTGLEILLENFWEEICFTPDTYWIQHGGADVRQWIAKLGSRTKILHLKDMKRLPDKSVTFAEIGEGNLWWESILPLAASMGIEYYVVEQDSCDKDPFEYLSKKMKALEE